MERREILLPDLVRFSFEGSDLYAHLISGWRIVTVEILPADGDRLPARLMLERASAAPPPTRRSSAP